MSACRLGYRCAVLGRMTMVIAVLVLFMPVAAGWSVREKKAVKHGCKLFYYFDGGTEMCEDCGEICDHADVKGTEKQCQRQCPDYLRAQQCRHGEEYFDEQTGTCSPCQDLCQHHRIRGTTRQCRVYCPDYQSPKKDEDKDTALPSPRSPADQKNEKKEDQKDPQQTVASSPSPHHLIWLVPTVVVLIFVTAVAVIFLLSRRSFQPQPQHVVKYQLASLGTESPRSGIHQPVVTTQENAPLTHPQAETQPGVNSELVCA